MITKINKITKNQIPATVRNSVWNIYIGSDIKKGVCFCCRTEQIAFSNFDCGHIQARSNNGVTMLCNLRPICGLCNNSMGTANMEEFMKKFGYVKNENWNGINAQMAEIVDNHSLVNDFIDGDFIDDDFIDDDFIDNDITDDNNIIDNKYEIIKNNFNYECLDRFNKTYFHTLDTFLKKKEYWEYFACKIRDAGTFIIKSQSIIDRSLINIEYDKKLLLTSFEHLRHYGDSFIKLWLIDETMACYDEKFFIAANGLKPLPIQGNDKWNFYNSFNGYNPEILTPIPENYEEIIKPYLVMVKELCEGDETNFNYYVNYLANLIQFPNNKCDVAVFFRGDEGCGKNLHLEAIANIIGRNHYLSTNKSDDIFGKFACSVTDKLLVNWNEANKIGDLVGELKTFITEEIKVSEQKNKNKIRGRNVARLIGTTNKLCPFPVHNNNERYLVLQCTEKYTNSQFLKNMPDIIKTPIFIASLYKYLNEIDLAIFDYKNFPKNTKAFKQMMIINTPNEVMFLKKYIGLIKDKSKIETIKGSDFFNKFIKYCNAMNLNDKMNIKIFYAKLDNLKLGNALNKKMIRGYVSIDIKPDVLCDKLIEMGHIAEDLVFIQE